MYAATTAGSVIDRMLVFDWRYTLADNELPKVVGAIAPAGTPVGPRFLDAIWSIFRSDSNLRSSSKVSSFDGSSRRCCVIFFLWRSSRKEARRRVAVSRVGERTCGTQDTGD